jgi:hypothetical protein
MAWLALAPGVAAAIVVACGTSANDVPACKQIETARCQAAASCPSVFDLSSPTPDGNGVSACIRFYDDQCLHGLVTTAVPLTTAVNGCVAAITKAGQEAAASVDAAAPCDLVANPQNYPACTFLNPIDAGEDAADAATTSEDASDDSSG